MSYPPLETQTYLVGDRGARVIFPDKTERSLPARAIVRFGRRPWRVIGKLYPLRSGKLSYEAPEIRRE